jgi:hypothetical protein
MLRFRELTKQFKPLSTAPDMGRLRRLMMESLQYRPELKHSPRRLLEPREIHARLQINPSHETQRLAVYLSVAYAFWESLSDFERALVNLRWEGMPFREIVAWFATRSEQFPNAQGVSKSSLHRCWARLEDRFRQQLERDNPSSLCRKIMV